MAIVRMKKILLIARQNDRDAVIRELERLGTVEIADIDPAGEGGPFFGITRDGDDKAAAAIEEELTDLRNAIRFISLYDRKKKPLLNVKKNITRAEFDRAAASNADALAKARSLIRSEEKLHKAKAEANRIEALVKSLKPWAELDIDIGGIATEHAPGSAAIGFFGDLSVAHGRWHRSSRGWYQLQFRHRFAQCRL